MGIRGLVGVASCPFPLWNGPAALAGLLLRLPQATALVARKECLPLSHRSPLPLIPIAPAFLLTSACWESNERRRRQE